MLPRPTLHYKAGIILVVSLSIHYAMGQDTLEAKRKVRYYERTLQISLFPGISTNGISSGSYFNKYSLNLFGGLNAGNRILEVGGVTNSHFQSSTGIQLAGFANISGTNAFVNLTLAEERSLIHRDFEVNNQGVQIAGVLNYVLNNVRGIQLSGGLNHAGSNFNGLQIAGIGNSSGGTSTGVHIAGAYNLVHESVAGLQVSAMFNYAGEYLSGTQIALMNRAVRMTGRNTTPPTKARSLQIGLLNFSKSMGGTQVGLINFGGDMRGKQIGLINFYHRLKSKEFSDAGVPIGLLNIGTIGSVFRLHVNEMFLTNIEYTTGNCQNCTWTVAGPIGMPYTEKNKKLNQNALILGINPGRDWWSFGWGFQKILLNKFSIRPFDKLNEQRVMSYGVRFLHINEQRMKIDKNKNLVTRLHFEWGRRGKKVLRSVYRYGGVALNYFIFETGSNAEGFNVQSATFTTGRLGALKARAWPGYSFGLHL